MSFSAKRLLLLKKRNSQGSYSQLSDLWNQPGNRSTEIYLKLGYIGNPASKGNWNNSTAYSTGELRAYPTGSPVVWRAKESVLAGENPPISNAKWELAIGADMVQNLGGGKYARTTLQRDEGTWVKMGPAEIGTYALSRFTYNPSLPPNYAGVSAAAAISTSTTSITIPTTHPGARTITIGTGLTIPNSTAVGSCTDNFAIPTTHPTGMSRNLPTGLTLPPGSTVTFYGDANNFFVFVVARYNSSTGLAYGASVAHVGTGTFSSWSLKTEKLRRVYRTANQTGQYMLVLVQSYDSGTGSLVFNSIKNVGTGTVSDWTYAIAREAINPTAAANNQFNLLDAESIGCWYVVTGTGTSFTHNCTRDNRGTGWKYIYADGPDVNTPPSDANVDTYNVSTITTSSVLIIDNLSPGTHTFLAVSMTSPSGVSANTRAWASASTGVSNPQTLIQQYNYDSFTADFAVVGQGQSNGEFAFRFRENADAGDALQWIPYHGALTMTADKIFTVDDVVIDVTQDFTTGLNPFALRYQPFTELVLEQSGNIIHPQAVGPVGTYSSTHTLTKDGVDFEARLDESAQLLFSVGYVTMLFLTKQFGKRIKFGTGNVYTPPQGVEADITLNVADLNSQSALVYNDGTGVAGEPNYAFANYNGGTEIPWLASSFINNYDATYNKLYPQVYLNNVINPGSTQTIRSKWYLGNRGSL